jgi:type IV pilus assembly protein PilO
MKLTARDKKLLIGLGIVIFIILSGRFLILPKFQKVSELNSEIAALKNTYSTNMVYKAKTEKMDSDIKILSAKLSDLRAIYPPNIDAPELLIVLKKLASESKINITQMKFNDYAEVKNDAANAASNNSQNGAQASSASAGENSTQGGAQTSDASIAGNQQVQQPNISTVTDKKILSYFGLWGLIGNDVINKYLNDGNSSSDSEKKVPDGKSYSVIINVEATGTNEQIKDFLDRINQLSTRACCKKTSISVSSDGKRVEYNDDKEIELKLTTDICFYGIMDSGAAGYYMLKDGEWIPAAAADDKTNLFKEYEGYTAEVSDNLSYLDSSVKESETESGKDKSYSGYDFSLVASAFGGGLAPSVSISCKNPQGDLGYSRPVVYGDNKGIENAEIFIEEKDGRFYCKFKTDHQSYPDAQYTQTFEFIPEGKDLRIVILSSERVDGNDKAGVNLNIINNTGRKLTYTIENEDKNSPRVEIGKLVGNVSHE